MCSIFNHCREYSKCIQFLIAGYIVVKCCLPPQCTHHVSTGYMGPCPQCEDDGAGCDEGREGGIEGVEEVDGVGLHVVDGGSTF